MRRLPLPLLLAFLLGCSAPSFAPEGGGSRATDRGTPRVHETVHLGPEGWRRAPSAGNEAAVPLLGPVVTPRAPFVDLVASWNVELRPGTGFEVELRLFEGDRTSPWLFLGSWGSADARQRRRLDRFEGGRVHVDTFAGAPGHRFDGAQLRVLALGDVRPASATLCFSAHGSPVAAPDTEPEARTWDVVLGVPARSQRSEAPELAARLCSPTSLAMVLAFHGVDVATSEVARRAWDPHFDLYGNWPRAAQTAFSFGVPAWVARFASWAPVEALVARGFPVILSLAVEDGALRGAPYDETPGHLLVVTGFDRNGDVHVNDPAATPEQGVARRYDREELERAWLGHGGVVYVLGAGARTVSLP